MCGIVGVGVFSQGGLFHKDLEIFRQALVGDSLRGVDGTGVVRVKKTGAYDFRKIEGDPFALYRAKGVAQWLTKSVEDGDPVVFGHNRFATYGKRSTANAHPFESNGVVLVHNGFISNLSEFGSAATKPEVDSHGLTVAMGEYDVMDVLETIRGAYSLVWYDSTNKTLNFARNYERPMFIGAQATMKRMIFGSEKPMLSWILERCKETSLSFEELPTQQWVSINMNGDVVERKNYTVKSLYATSGGTYTGSTTVNTPYSDDDWVKNEAGVWVHVSDAGEPPEQATKSAVKPPPPPPPAVVQHTSSRPVVVPFDRNKYWEAKRSDLRATFPDSICGYKIGDAINWVALDNLKTNPTREQYCVIGSDPMNTAIEVRGYTSGNDNLKRYMAADMLSGIVRGLEIKPNGVPTIIVKDMEIVAEELEEDVTKSIDTSGTLH